MFAVDGLDTIQEREPSVVLVNHEVSASDPTDEFAFALRKGDILSAEVQATAPVDFELLSADNTVLAFNRDAQNTKNLDFVITESGDYSVKVTQQMETSAFNVLFDLSRPAIEFEEVGTNQYLFLEFDEVTIEEGEPFPTPLQGQQTFSPLSSFLQAFGLDTGTEDLLAQAIVDVVREDFIDMPGLTIVSSLDPMGHSWGLPNVSRVIVGGTTAQIGIPAIGFAGPSDIGNSNPADQAIVTLDVLSAPTGESSLNDGWQADPSVDRIEYVAAAIGRIVSHEAGHLFGLEHTDTGIMDNVGIFGGTDNIYGNEAEDNLAFATSLVTFPPQAGFLQDSPALLSAVFQTGTAHIVTTTANEGEGSFRDAISKANGADDRSIIRFDLDDSPGQTPEVTVTNVPLNLMHPVTVEGNGVRVNLQPSAGMLTISQGAGVELSELSIAGEGMLNQGNLTLDRSEFSGASVLTNEGTLRLGKGFDPLVVPNLVLTDTSTLELKAEIRGSFGPDILEQQSIHADSATIAGKLVLELVIDRAAQGLFPPTSATSPSVAFDFIVALNSPSGFFGNVDTTILEDLATANSRGLVLAIDYTSGANHAVTAVATFLGDVDLDGDVDGADLSAVSINYDPLGINDNYWRLGDVDQDGDVDGADLSAVSINFNPLGEL